MVASLKATTKMILLRRSYWITCKHKKYFKPYFCDAFMWDKFCFLELLRFYLYLCYVELLNFGVRDASTLIHLIQVLSPNSKLNPIRALT